MTVLPFTQDRDTGGFFDAAKEGRLVYRACNDCDHAMHPPTARCYHCGSWDTEWREARGTGKLHAWTTVVHQVHPDFPTPYTLVVVEIDETPEVRLISRIDGDAPRTRGEPMEVWFESLAEGVMLPQWRPAAA